MVNSKQLSNKIKFIPKLSVSIRQVTAKEILTTPDANNDQEDFEDHH